MSCIQAGNMFCNKEGKMSCIKAGNMFYNKAGNTTCMKAGNTLCNKEGNIFCNSTAAQTSWAKLADLTSLAADVLVVTRCACL